MSIRIAAELYVQRKASISVLALLAVGIGPHADELELAADLADVANLRSSGEISEVEARAEVAQLLGKK